MFYRLPFLLARRVAGPAAAPRVSLTRPFSYTPSAFSPTRSKSAVAKPKPKVQTNPKAKAKPTTKPKPKPKAKVTASGKKKATAAKKSPFSLSQLKMPVRRPPGAYVTFLLEQMKNTPKTKTPFETTDRVRRLAAEWKALSPEQQQVYKDKSAVLVPGYKAAFDAWVEKTDPAILREINKRRKARGKPKIRFTPVTSRGPVPAFMRFLGDFRADHPDLKGKELGIQGGAAWHQLPPARKEVYLSAYQNAKKAQEAEA